MLSRLELRDMAKARLRDAEVLTERKRYDGAVYLCGYAIELKLKARICRTLRWTGFPATKKEFKGLGTFRTHDLDLLLQLSGVESKIRSQHLVEWSVFAGNWDSEVRYRPIGSASGRDAQDMIEAARNLLKALQ